MGKKQYNKMKKILKFEKLFEYHKYLDTIIKKSSDDIDAFSFANYLEKKYDENSVIIEISTENLTNVFLF
jgi:hypothetical protein